MKFVEEFRNEELAKSLVKRLQEFNGLNINIIWTWRIFPTRS